MSQNPSQRGHGRSDEAIAARWLAHDLREYDETRNPVFMWEAIAECLYNNLPFPPAVLAYLRRVSSRFTKLSRGEIPSKGQIAQVLAQALEFRRGRATGARNPLMAMADTEHEIMIAFEVYQQCVAGHSKEDSAFQRVTETHPAACAHPRKCRKISRSTVRAYWKKHAAAFPACFRKVRD